MNVTLENLLALIGDKEVTIVGLKAEIAELRKKIDELSKPAAN